MGQGLTTQGWWTRADGLPTGNLFGGGPDMTNRGGGGGGTTGNANADRNLGGISTGYTATYVYDRDSYATVRVDMVGWFGSAPGFPTDPLSFLPVTRNEPTSRLARAMNWIATNHPELRPRSYRTILAPLRQGTYGGYSVWRGTITIDPAQVKTDAAYVDVLAHELYHAADPAWRTLLIQAAQPYDPLGWQTQIGEWRVTGSESEWRVTGSDLCIQYLIDCDHVG
jgi:hypothetical protein